MHQQRGFTIIELMVTLVVFTILVGIAAPNLSEFLLTQRVSGQASELINSLALARSEAGKRNASIVVIPSNQ
jgi:type IV fimbrial biogenesis protein FimT